MPKVETFLKSDEIEDIEERAKEAGISRSAWIRDAVLEKLGCKAVEYRNNKVLEGK